MFSRVFFSIFMVYQAICTTVIEQDEDMTDFCSGVDYKKYCLPIGECVSGSHVMCMYYRPEKLMGPHCIDGRMIRLQAEHKKIILDKINGARADIATGTATGENDTKLPRGYSMFKVKWDKRLAVFAQVWANQCRFTKDDQCRATKRFHNPGQFLGAYKYTLPDWRPEDDNGTGPLGKQCLTTAKVKYALASSIDVMLVERYWAGLEYVMQHSSIRTKNHFMMMVYGKITHIGCGLSAYKDYHWSEDLHFEFYYLELVCNLSAQPKDGEILYTIEPPSLSKYNVTPECGCPVPQYMESDNCLCVLQRDANKPSEEDDSTEDDTGTEDEDDIESTQNSNPDDEKFDYDYSSGENENRSTTRNKHTTPSMKDGTTERYGLGGSEKPSVLILPIITIDDAPADLRESPWKSSSQDNSTNQWFDDLNDILDVQSQNTSTSKLISSIDQNSQNTNKTVLGVDNFNLNNTLQSLQNFNQNKLDLGSDNKTFSTNLTTTSSRKSSIFTRVAPFDLSSQNQKKPMDSFTLKDKKPTDSATLNKNLKTFLKEVPKKDLSRLEELFLKFIIKKQSESVDKQNSVNPLLSSFIRPQKSYYELSNQGNNIDLTSKSDLANDIQYHNQRIGNMVEDTENINDLKDLKKVVPIKIKEKDRVVKTKFHFDVPVIRKQSPLVKDKDNDIYHRKTYIGNNEEKNDIESGSKAHIDSRKTANTDKWVNSIKVLGNFRSNPDAKYKYEKEMADESKQKRTQYLHNEIKKLKDKLKHLHQYLDHDSLKDARFRPVMTERRSMKSDNAKNSDMPDRPHTV